MGWIFDGTNDYVTIADNTGLSLPDGDWTIAVWLKPEATGSALINVLSHGTPFGSPSTFLRYSQASFALPGRYDPFKEDSDGDNVNPQTGNNAVVDDTWQHVSIERSGNDCKIYVDDVEEGTSTNASLNGINPTGSFYLGAASDNQATNTYDGTMAEFAIWTDVNSSRRTALAGGANYEDYTTNRTQYISKERPLRSRR